RPLRQHQLPESHRHHLSRAWHRPAYDADGFQRPAAASAQRRGAGAGSCRLTRRAEQALTRSLGLGSRTQGRRSGPHPGVDMSSEATTLKRHSYALRLALNLGYLCRGHGVAAEKQGIRNDSQGDALPTGALARLGSTRLRHAMDGDLMPAFSPDGKTIITAGTNSLRSWDAATGKVLWQRTENHSPSASLFSPDGRLLMTRDRDSITLLDPATGRLVR